MPNADQPRGFWPVGKLLRVRPYEAGSACYPGDLVNLASDGQVDPATAGALIVGLCLSYASAAGTEVLVADHPDQLIGGQGDETEFDAQTDIGNCVDIVATAGDSTYLASRQEADSSTIAATTAQLQILGIERRIDNALGTNADMVFRIHEHAFGGAGGATAGV